MLFSAAAAGAAHPDALASILHHPISSGVGMLTDGSIPWREVLYCGLLTTDLTLLMEVFALQDVSSVDAALIVSSPARCCCCCRARVGDRL